MINKTDTISKSPTTIVARPRKSASVAPQKEIIATGRRKSAIAKVKLVAGAGKLITSDKGTLSEGQLKNIFLPLAIAGCEKKYNILASVEGGGVQSRVEAIRLGVARAMVVIDADTKTILRKNGLLTRDNRVKERKKPGLKRARRAPQWAKR
jgi:small subunit ribosomal protein S9